MGVEPLLTGLSGAPSRQFLLGVTQYLIHTFPLRTVLLKSSRTGSAPANLINKQHAALNRLTDYPLSCSVLALNLMYGVSASLLIACVAHTVRMLQLPASHCLTCKFLKGWQPRSLRRRAPRWLCYTLACEPSSRRAGMRVSNTARAGSCCTSASQAQPSPGPPCSGTCMCQRLVSSISSEA
jgi:hypothetical protein